MSEIKFEKRYLPGVEIRAEGDKRTLIGKAVVYNSPSEDMGFIEIVRPGAFTDSVKTADVRALIDHDCSLIIGRSASGTLRLNDGPDALSVEIDLPNTSYANDLIESVRLGNVTGMSFGFMGAEDEWTTTDDGKPLRYINKAEIFEVSCVSFPAYPETSLALRSLDAWKRTQVQVPIEVYRLKVQINERLYQN